MLIDVCDQMEHDKQMITKKSDDVCEFLRLSRPVIFISLVAKRKN